MSKGSVHIDRLRLVTPLEQDEARGFGERTARKLLEILAHEGFDGEIGDLNVRVSREDGADADRLAHKIADEIRRRVR